MVEVQLLSREEYRAIEDRRLAAPKIDDRFQPMTNFYKPGMMWYCPWYHDFEDPEDAPKYAAVMDAIQSGKFDGKTYLSIHYWRDWAAKRPPLCVVTPDGRHWVIDSKSSNGDGWVVTGEPPLVTCAPSIEMNTNGSTDSYHGFLRGGEFTPDLGGKTWAFA